MHAYSQAALHVDHGSKRIDSESLGIELIPKVGMDPIKRNRLLTQSLFQFNKAYLCLYASQRFHPTKAARIGCTSRN